MYFLKKMILASLLITYFIACKHPESTNQAQAPNAEEIIENYGDGTKSRSFTRVNGQIEGKMTDFYIDGKIKAERHFKDGVQIGKTTLYFPSGAIKEVQYYENGLKNGGDTVFYENGQPEFALEYKDEKRNGFLRKWTDEGVLVYEARFEMDSLVEVKGEKLKK